MNEFNADNPILIKAFKLDPLFRELLKMDSTNDMIDIRQVISELKEKHGLEFFMEFAGALSENYKKAINSGTVRTAQ